MVARFSMWNASVSGLPSGKGRGQNLSDHVIFYADAQNAVIPGGVPYINIVDMTHVTAAQRVNRLFVKYSNGMLTVDGAPTQAEMGEIVEQYLTLDVATRAEALTLARRHFDEISTSNAIVTVVLQPTGHYDVPYLHFDIGDWVTAPAADLTPTVYRVLGITITGNSEGDATILVELNRRAYIAEQDRHNLFQTLGSGEIGAVKTSKTVSGYVGSGD